MSCPNCHSDLPIEYGFCPACRAFVGATQAPRRTGNYQLRLSLVSLVVIATFAVLFIRVGGVAIVRGVVRKWLYASASPPVERVGERPVGYPVEHGGIASLEELHGHGKLYFVPMGRQWISVQSLADYYQEKFKLKITVLPEAALKSSSCVPLRRQCSAEEMLDDARRAYPRIARDPDSVIIILTDEDIFCRSSPEFTYSFHDDGRFGVVSTRRMDPAAWGDPPNQRVRLASTRQMLTKYVALLYFRLPISYDPTSILYQPLTPDGGPDYIYESDVHSEESVNGLRGQTWPCIFFGYSYKTGRVQALQPGQFDCDVMWQPRSSSEETFQLEFSYGRFVDRSLDLQVDASPPMELRRGYVSGDSQPRAFGLGTSHNYNSYLTSDGPNKLTYVEVMQEDGTRLHFDRISPGIGLTRDAVWEDDSHWGGAYGARISWEGTLLKLQYRDGSWSRFLSCGDETCYWTAYQDEKGNALRFERDEKRSLRSLTSSDNRKLDFELDSQRRVTRVKASNGKSLSYVYDDAGRLVQVTRADGQVTTYSYDSRHHMTQVAVSRTPGETPRTLITNEYDSYGRVVKATVADVGIYQIQYLSWVRNHTGEARMTDPAGRVWNFSLSDQGYNARTFPTRFPAKELMVEAGAR